MTQNAFADKANDNWRTVSTPLHTRHTLA